MTTIDSSYDPCAWGPHLPALLGCLADTVGMVLEIGVGHFSTPALHAYCGAAGRKLVSVEKDDAWMKTFRGNYQCPGHSFVDGVDFVPTSVTGRWAVVLIDDSPGGQNRADHFAHFIDKSTFVVVPDYHRENEEAIKPLLPGLYTHITRTYQPPTLIASKVRSSPSSILCL